jgi:hypothetical protein
MDMAPNNTLSLWIWKSLLIHLSCDVLVQRISVTDLQSVHYILSHTTMEDIYGDILVSVLVSRDAEIPKQKCKTDVGHWETKINVNGKGCK